MIDVMEQSKIPTRELYSGEKIPCVGLGTFGSDKYGADAVSEAVYGAVKYGYRLIDCASVYQNEDKIGQVLHRLFEEKVVQAGAGKDCPCGESDVQPVVDKTFLLGNVSGYSPCTG